MEEKRESNTSSTSATSFTGALEISKMGAASVPTSYVLPATQRPNLGLNIDNDGAVSLPVIDLSLLHQPNHKPRMMEQVRFAFKELGFFQVINHGIRPSVMNDALDAATEFFDLPAEEKTRLASDNVHEPVRYGTSLNHVQDKVLFWRDFIKHYSHPISTWINSWPSNPQCYKEKMGEYAEAMHVLHKQLVQIMFDSLGLNPNYLHQDIEEGCQVIAVNYYPSCPEPDLVLGIPPHTDYGYLTILLQNQEGLEIKNRENIWCKVPAKEGALVIQTGDQTEIISNGRYRSSTHRATVHSDRSRISIASIHSLAIDQKVGPAPELVNEEHPALYKQGSFREFLDYLSKNDIMEGPYLDTLKLNQ